MARKIEVQLVGDSRSLERAFGRSQTAGSKWSHRLGVSAKAGGLAVAAGVGLGLVALKKSVDAAKESELSQARMRAQLKASGLSWEAHRDRIDRVIEAQSRLSALDDEDLQDSFTNLVRVTGDVNKALKLNALAADFARAKGIDVAKAGELIGKVAGGNTGILSRYGITLKDGATAQEALAVLQKKFAGQAEAYGDSTAGAQEKFGVALENLQEKIGQKVLPILAKLFEHGVVFMDWAERNWPRFQQIIGQVVDAVRPHFERLVAYWTETLMPTIQSIIDFARDLWARFGEDIKRNLAAAVAIVRAQLNIIKGIVEFVMALIRGDWSAAWNSLKDIARNALKMVLKIIGTFKDNAFKAAKALGGKIKDGIVAGVAGLGNALAAAIRAAVNWIIGKVNDISGKINKFSPFADIPTIPELATGGKIVSTGLAVVHRGETVLPARVDSRGAVAAAAGGGQFALIWAGPDFFRWVDEQQARRRRGGHLG